MLKCQLNSHSKCPSMRWLLVKKTHVNIWKELSDHLRGTRQNICRYKAHQLPFSVDAIPSFTAPKFFSWASASQWHRLSISSKLTVMSGYRVVALLPVANIPYCSYRALTATCLFWGLEASPSKASAWVK